MPKSLFFLLLSLQLAVLMVASSGRTTDLEAPPASSRCSVCGMFVAKYPNWLTRIHYDSPDSTLFFDGVKDMMAFYFAPEKYGGAPQETIRELFVKDYYRLKWLDGRKAYYVVGSDVYGPMGYELIPFGSMKAAESFVRDHHGEKILTFDAITPDLIESLRQNQKMR